MHKLFFDKYDLSSVKYQLDDRLLRNSRKFSSKSEELILAVLQSNFSFVTPKWSERQILFKLPCVTHNYCMIIKCELLESIWLFIQNPHTHADEKLRCGICSFN